MTSDSRSPRFSPRDLAVPAVLAAAVLMAWILFDPRAGIGGRLVQVTLLAGIGLAVLRIRRLVRAWRQLLLAAAALGLSLGALALAGPWLVDRYFLPDYDTDLDHRPRAMKGRVNADGVQPDVPAEDYAEDDFVVVFLGDSFTEGIGLEDRGQAFAFVAEAELQAARPDARIRAVNFGWTSSSPVLQLRQLRDIGRRYRPDLVVQCLDMTDFFDDLEYTRRLAEQGADDPRYVSIFHVMGAVLSRWLGSDALRPRIRRAVLGDAAPGSSRGSVRTAPDARGLVGGRLFAMAQPLERSRPHMETTWATLLELEDETTRLGAEFAVVVLARYQQYNLDECPGDWETPPEARDGTHALEPVRYFQERAGEAPFPIRCLADDFRDSGVFPTTFEDDPHYNEAGHRVAGQAIARYLLAEELLPR